MDRCRASQRWLGHAAVRVDVHSPHGSRNVPADLDGAPEPVPIQGAKYTGASAILERSGDPEAVPKILLGHSDTRTTQRYAKVSAHDRRTCGEPEMMRRRQPRLSILLAMVAILSAAGGQDRPKAERTPDRLLDLTRENIKDASWKTSAELSVLGYRLGEIQTGGRN